MTLLNLFGIGGVGVMQSVSSRVHGAVAVARAELAAAEALGAMTAVGEASLRGHQGLLEARDGSPGRALGFLRSARERFAALGAWSSAATWAALAAQSAAAAGGDPSAEVGDYRSASGHAEELDVAGAAVTSSPTGCSTTPGLATPAAVAAMLLGLRRKPRPGAWRCVIR